MTAEVASAADEKGLDRAFPSRAIKRPEQVQQAQNAPPVPNRKSGHGFGSGWCIASTTRCPPKRKSGWDLVRFLVQRDPTSDFCLLSDGTFARKRIVIGLCLSSTTVWSLNNCTFDELFYFRLGKACISEHARAVLPQFRRIATKLRAIAIDADR